MYTQMEDVNHGESATACSDNCTPPQFDNTPTSRYENGDSRKEAETEVKKTFFPIDSGYRRDLLLAILLMGAIVGIAAGVQAMFQGSKARGVFSNLCTEKQKQEVALHGTDEDGEWCDAQESATAVVAAALFSFINAISFVDGIFVDAVGGRRSAILFGAMWAISTCAAGIDYERGYIWAASMLTSVWAVEGAMLCVLVYHLKLVCQEREDLYSFWSGGFTCLWDLGTLISIPIGHYWIRGVTSVPFELSWALLGFVFAVPLLVWLGYFSKKHRNQLTIPDGLQMMERRAAKRYELEQGHDNCDQLDAPGLSCGQAICTTLRSNKVVVQRLVRSPTFWLVTGQALCTVTTTAFFIANIGLAINRLGGNQGDVSEGRLYLAYIRGSCGLLYFIPGFIAQRLGVVRGVTYLEFGLALNAIGILFAALFQPESYSLARTILLIFIFCTWRAFTFSSLNILILERFNADFQDNIAFIYGLIYSIGGIFSLIVGAVATSWVHEHPENFVVLLGLLCAMSTIVHLAIGINFARKGKEESETTIREGEEKLLG